MGKVSWIIVACVILASCAQPNATRDSTKAEQPYELLIRNGSVVDGTGAPAYRADVLIAGDTIAAIDRSPHDVRKLDQGDLAALAAMPPEQVRREAHAFLTALAKEGGASGP